MDEFANLPAAERQLYFEQTAAGLGLATQIIEKDFWVCWALRVLFSIDSYRDHLTFKGGTSLSKVYNVIERFSEDIDFAVSRELLGFVDDDAPEAEGISGKQRKKRVSELSKDCQERMTNDFQPKLRSAIEARLNGDDWKLDYIDDEKQNQVFYFTYPHTSGTSVDGYNRPIVRIELTARTDDHPSQEAIVRPYIVDQYPDAIVDADTSVNVLTAERTFWEKATILHLFRYQHDPKRIGDRISRHYYDVYQLSKNGIADKALAQLDLLTEVADHKNVYYPQSWARYDLARHPETLSLLPNDDILDALRDDYEAMGEMFFSEPPPFSAILQELTVLEQRIQSTR